MTQADVLILGGGLVAGALAVALDTHGLSAIVVDPADPGVMLAQGFDGRASAVASTSGRMLDAIGIGARIAGQGCEIRHIRVSDGLAPGKLDFIPGDVDGALGTMYENRLLRRAIHEAAATASRVDLRMRRRAVSVDRGAHRVTATLDDGAAVDLPARLPEAHEERAALFERMVDARPDKAKPFPERHARARRARLIMQSLGRTFDREPLIDLSQYPNNWPELARQYHKAA